MYILLEPFLCPHLCSIWVEGLIVSCAKEFDFVTGTGDRAPVPKSYWSCNFFRIW